jgi:hypothetical protein
VGLGGGGGFHLATNRSFKCETGSLGSFGRKVNWLYWSLSFFSQTFYTGVKCPKREARHSLPSSAELPPYVVMASYFSTGWDWINLAENRVGGEILWTRQCRFQFLKTGNFLTFLSDYQHLKQEPATANERRILKAVNCYTQCIKWAHNGEIGKSYRSFHLLFFISQNLLTALQWDLTREDFILLAYLTSFYQLRRLYSVEWDNCYELWM